MCSYALFMIIQEIVMAMRFGTLDREEGTFVGITMDGGLTVKTLRREREIETKQYHSMERSKLQELQERPLPLPSKTKLFLDQRVREKAEAAGICNHSIFIF
jgi:hypothetical protein